MVNLKSAPFFLNDEQVAWVNSTRDSLSLEEKAGQLLCVNAGSFPHEELKQRVADGKLGSVLYRPMSPGAVIAEKFVQLDEVAKIPLLKASNLEEGGSGGMKDGTLFGWPMLTAATDDVEMAEKFGKVCGVEGASIGINWTFSPVCDLDVNYMNPITNVRTFGSDTQRVKAMTENYVKAIQACGVAACAKHYPGDGVDYRDQHLHPTYNTLSAEDWYNSYGAVYENLIANGLTSVMVGHIAQPNVAKDMNPSLSFRETMMPATLSPTLLTGVLRGKYGFNGVITTDATIMSAYTMAMERERAIPTSIMAGCDVLVFSTDYDEDIKYILAGLESGLLTHERLDEAVTRVLALKAKYCRKFENEPVPAAAWHEEAADKAITLVKNTQPDKLPMTPDRYPKIRLITLGKDNILHGSVREIATKVLEENGFEVECYDPMQDDLHGTSDIPANRFVLYMANLEHASNQTTVRITWSRKHALDVPRHPNEEIYAFVSLANPYHLQDAPMVRTYVNAYTATETTIRLAIEKLMGKSEFKGVSPVDAFCGLADTKL